jgi:hypothetical protein
VCSLSNKDIDDLHNPVRAALKTLPNIDLR